MRTTLNIDEKLLAAAQKSTGIEQKTKLVRMGLESLIQREAARKLALLGGSDPAAKAAPRRRLR